MDINPGDRVLVEGRSVGMGQRTGECVGCEGEGDRRRIWVRWDDGHQSMLVPGPDLRVEPPRRAAS